MKKGNLEIILESIQSKFELVLEGHEVLRMEIQDTKQELREDIGLVNVKVEALNQKIDSVDVRLSKKIDSVESRLSQRIDDIESHLSQKIDAVAADLSAHRADTEAHENIYKVKED